MQVFVKIDFVTSVMRQTKRPYWRLFDGTNKLLMDTIQPFDNISVEDSIKLLEDTIKSSEGIFCILRLYSVKPSFSKAGDDAKSTSGNIYEYRIELQKQASNQNQIASINNQSNDYLERIFKLQSEIQQINFNNQLEMLKREFAAKSTEEKSDPLMEKIAGMAERLGTFYMSQKMNPNGSNQVPQNNQKIGIFGTDDDKKKFQELIITWAKNDPDYLAALNAIVWYAVNQPEQYNFYLSTLKSQVK